jgi:hypothetical protein
VSTQFIPFSFFIVSTIILELVLKEEVGGPKAWILFLLLVVWRWAATAAASGELTEEEAAAGGGGGDEVQQQQSLEANDEQIRAKMIALGKGRTAAAAVSCGLCGS